MFVCGLVGVGVVVVALCVWWWTYAPRTLASVERDWRYDDLRRSNATFWAWMLAEGLAGCFASCFLAATTNYRCRAGGSARERRTWLDLIYPTTYVGVMYLQLC